MRRNNSWLDSMVTLICGDGSAHNMTACILYTMCIKHTTHYKKKKLKNSVHQVLGTSMMNTRKVDFETWKQPSVQCTTLESNDMIEDIQFLMASVHQNVYRWSCRLPNTNSYSEALDSFQVQDELLVFAEFFIANFAVAGDSRFLYIQALSHTYHLTYFLITLLSSVCLFTWDPRIPWSYNNHCYITHAT